MNHRRAAVAALAAAGLLALGACGDPDSPQQAAQAQPERGAAEANQRALDAHRKFQRAVELGRSSPNLLIQDSIDEALRRKQAEEAAAKTKVAYLPASPDQIERRAVAAAEAKVHYAPVSPDQIERRALASISSPWWTHKR
jgi:hypothetical protein